MTDETPNYYQAPGSETGPDDLPPSPETEGAEWGPTKRVVFANLAILAGYTTMLTLTHISIGGPYAGMAAGIWMLILVGGQCVINLIASVAAFLSDRSHWASAYLLGFTAVGLLGFSACFGVMAFV